MGVTWDLTTRICVALALSPQNSLAEELKATDILI